MSSPGHTGRLAEALCSRVVISSARSSVTVDLCEQYSEHDILKMSEPILIQIGTSGPRGEDMK